jgi:hypothetical protein
MPTMTNCSYPLLKKAQFVTVLGIIASLSVKKIRMSESKITICPDEKTSSKKQ